MHGKNAATIWGQGDSEVRIKVQNKNIKEKKSVTEFSDVKLPKPAETLQWHHWFFAGMCAFRRKIAEAGRLLPSTVYSTRVSFVWQPLWYWVDSSV